MRFWVVFKIVGRLSLNLKEVDDSEISRNLKTADMESEEKIIVQIVDLKQKSQSTIRSLCTYLKERGVDPSLQR